MQLNWGTDVREGRFLLRNEDHPTVRVSVIYKSDRCVFASVMFIRVGDVYQSW